MTTPNRSREEAIQSLMLALNNYTNNAVTKEYFEERMKQTDDELRGVEHMSQFSESLDAVNDQMERIIVELNKPVKKLEHCSIVGQLVFFFICFVVGYYLFR